MTSTSWMVPSCSVTASVTVRSKAYAIRLLAGEREARCIVSKSMSLTALAPLAVICHRSPSAVKRTCPPAASSVGGTVASGVASVCSCPCRPASAGWSEPFGLLETRRKAAMATTAAMAAMPMMERRGEVAIVGCFVRGVSFVGNGVKRVVRFGSLLHEEVLLPFPNMAERVGFEPTVAHTDHNGFRDRPIQPLWHLSERRVDYTNRVPASRKRKVSGKLHGRNA